MRYSIVGMNHRGTEAFVAALKPGVEVTLVREPLNTYDRNAVAVWIDGVHVGYIPKHSNRDLARKIDAEGGSWTPPRGTIATDAKDGVVVHKAVDASFTRSPNSGYPMVEIE